MGSTTDFDDFFLGCRLVAAIEKAAKPHKFEAAGVGFLIETNIKGVTDALPKDPIATINRLIEGAESAC